MALHVAVDGAGVSTLWMATAGLSGLLCLCLFNSSSWFIPQFVKSYKLLQSRDQRDWDSRIPSTVHAVVITALSASVILMSNTFDAATNAQVPFLYRVSDASNLALGFSLGYFVVDMALMFIYYPSMGGPEMVVHHIASLASVLRALLGQYAHLYTLAMLSTEITTPSINLRWMLDRCSLKTHWLYIWNGMLMMVLWFTNRIMMFVPFFWHMYQHRDEISTMAPFDLGLVFVVPLLLLCLNTFWFNKIVRGAMKSLRRRTGVAVAVKAKAEPGQSKVQATAVARPLNGHVQYRSTSRLVQTPTEAAAGHA